MDWMEVSIFTTTAGIEPVEAVLDGQGIEGYVLEDAADFEAFLADTEIYWDYVDEDLCREKRGQETTLKIYLEDSPAGMAQLESLRTALDGLRAQDTEGAYGRLTTETALTRQEDWEWGWKQYFKPFPVGETFLVKPSWETVEDAGGRTILEIDPASSFGTGTHETTQLCIAALEGLVHGGERLLDMGTGSGILAIAAALRGARPETLVDIDPGCLRCAQENAERNGVTLGQCLTGDALRDPALCETIGTDYDLICANIVADVLIGMRTLFVRWLKVGGNLICSGILDERADEVAAALTAAGLTLTGRTSRGGWTALTARREA